MHGNGTGGSLATAMTLSQGGNLAVEGNISLPDSCQLNLGSDNDLEIYHTGSHAFIDNNKGIRSSVISSPLFR